MEQMGALVVQLHDCMAAMERLTKACGMMASREQEMKGDLAHLGKQV